VAITTAVVEVRPVVPQSDPPRQLRVGELRSSRGFRLNWRAEDETRTTERCNGYDKLISDEENAMLTLPLSN